MHKLESLYEYTNWILSMAAAGVQKIIYLILNLPSVESLPALWFLFLLLSVLSYLFYPFLGLRGFLLINVLGVLPFWLSCTYWFSWFVIESNELLFYVGNLNWIAESTQIPFRISFNKLTFSFGYLTLSIGMFVMLYSLFYFRGEPTSERLTFLLMLFVNSMLLLLFSDNIMVTFIGWEMIGVTSFFLINYWNSRLDTLKSAKKALVFNLLSDSLLVIALVLIYRLFGSTEIQVINSSCPTNLNTCLEIGHLQVGYLPTISFLLLVSSCIKSAQLVFHAWLPDSMEAPAPASALIHSATLVSAGIFLLARLNPLWTNTCISVLWFNFYIENIIILWGSLTAAYGGLVASKQTDLKRILAYSTISHCGYMMVLVGCGDTNALIFYFYIHGMFKALLFLVTGNIMRFYATQDLRKMGNAWHRLPLEGLICIFGFMNLSGAPFSLGYVAKHSVVTLTPHYGLTGTLITFLLILGACASVFYSLEFIRCVFFEPAKSTKSMVQSYRDDNLYSKYNNPTGNIGLLVLVAYCVYAITVGLYLSIKLIDYPEGFSYLTPMDYNSSLPKSKELPIYGYSALSIPVVTCYAILISLLSYVLHSNRQELSGLQILVWLIPLLFGLHLLTSVYNLTLDPSKVFNLLLVVPQIGKNVLSVLLYLINSLNTTIGWALGELPALIDYSSSWLSELNEFTPLSLAESAESSVGVENSGENSE